MAILKVARMGHPVLRKRAEPLEPREIATPRIQRLIDDMFETMHDSRGIGLAGPQVHESVRLFVAGVDDPDGGMPPVVVSSTPRSPPIGSAMEEDWEGCLSIPDIRGRVPPGREDPAARPRPARAAARPDRRRVSRPGPPARDRSSLDGVLFFDRMTSFESVTFIEEYGRYWARKDDD